MRRVVYLMSGAAHLPYLVVSLYTLRKHWSGEVAVFAWPESYDIALNIARDLNLAVTVRRRVPLYRGKNDQFLDKILLVRDPAPDVFSTSLYLDADTIIKDKVTPLLDNADRYGFVATQFNHWDTSGAIIRGRIERLRGTPGIPATHIDAVLNGKWPSVNGGVFAAHNESPVLPVWYEWAMAAREIFIADETVLHILQHKFPEQMTVMTGGQWNCSLKHRPATLSLSDVVVLHGHGDCFTRPDKCKAAVDLWYPLYRHCLAENIGRMADWRCLIQHRWLDKLECGMV